ncbi:MAG: hypothetical protein JNM70_13605 [Anaerolineae bacterium]|nr:hypothetical protein [Anaerolineae bacterium]
MPTTPQALLDRLDSIAAGLRDSGQGLALLGLGSVGLETGRLDAYSDLDFFAIVQPGSKPRFIDTLDWMEAAAPLVYAFRNTVDGYKALYADGIFAEFAVFEPQELAGIPFSPGRLVWSADGFDARTLVPTPADRERHTPSVEWLLGEALTNLYVGLGRYLRGEKLSAARFVQVYAVDHLVRLAPRLETEQPAYVDVFTAERRFEARFPVLAAKLAEWMGGYDHTPESALTILTFLEARFTVNAALAGEIRALAAAAQNQKDA